MNLFRSSSPLDSQSSGSASKLLCMRNKLVFLVNSPERQPVPLGIKLTNLVLAVPSIWTLKKKISNSKGKNLEKETEVRLQTSESRSCTTHWPPSMNFSQYQLVWALSISFSIMNGMMLYTSPSLVMAYLWPSPLAAPHSGSSFQKTSLMKLLSYLNFRVRFACRPPSTWRRAWTVDSNSTHFRSAPITSPNRSLSCSVRRSSCVESPIVSPFPKLAAGAAAAVVAAAATDGVATSNKTGRLSLLSASRDSQRWTWSSGCWILFTDPRSTSAIPWYTRRPRAPRACTDGLSPE
mmetsp:Transcript_24117/g.65763  ORF Transcript_24117/g.65763 Transcript_24117/m.65763 type:complete len:293 (+) Transcript_24117:859-1737(+)